MTPPFQPYREPLHATLLRTVIIALVIGAILARRWGGLVNWPMATLLALWPSFGGHWVEIAFLNGMRPRLPAARSVQIAARLATWFVGGVLLALCVGLTSIALGRPFVAGGNGLWIGGLAFIAIELLVHTVLQLRGRPSFYNGRG